MIVTVKDFMEKKAGTVPMMGRNRLRSEFFATCLYELEANGKQPCYIEGWDIPAVCTVDEFGQESMIEPMSWGDFLRRATYDIQVGIDAGWLIKVGETLLVARDIPENYLIETDAARDTKLAALQLFKDLRMKTIQEEKELGI